jgi:flagellar biosynthesis protein FlhF
MNVKRFVGKNAREAMAQARAAYGDQAVVLSNRPVPGGVEILAMAGADVPATPATLAALPAPAASLATTASAPMSTVSFQDFVRERQRQDAQAALAAAAPARAEEPAPMASFAAAARRAPPVEPGRFAAEALEQELAQAAAAPAPRQASATSAARAFSDVAEASAPDLVAEIKALRSTLTAQLATMTWFDSVRRSPAQTQLLRLMIANGFSPALARQLVHRLDPALDEARAEQWLLQVLARNLRCAEQDSIQNKGGVFALVGPTGVGKTTTTAKIAANFAREHGAGSVGLITVDTYRMAASDQLRAFGRLLNIPVHTARDSASLTDLLDLFGGKKLVLIDTVGVGQRDRRLAELFAALPAGRIKRLLVLNAAAQAETLDEVVQAYSAGPGTRCVITKLDEAVKCGGAIDVAVRHQLLVEGMANGQRVPEDWHAARAPLLVQKALMKPASATFMPDDVELGLMLTAPPSGRAALRGAQHA